MESENETVIESGYGGAEMEKRNGAFFLNKIERRKREGV